MVLFFQKKPAQRYQPSMPPQEYIPVDIVQRMASQGMPEPQIISQLRAQGFSPMQIDKALSQAIKSAVTLPQSNQMRSAPPERIVPGPQVRAAIEPVMLPEPPSFDFSPQQQTMPQEFTFEENPQQFAEKPEVPQQVSGPEITLEEVIEGVIADRWTSFEKRMSGLDQRDQQLDQRIEDLRKQVDDARALVSKSEQTFVGKLDEYGGHIGGIEARIGSIEKVFKDFLPELTDNVRTISGIVEKMRKDERSK